jgi:predicted membrane channel-forming protein YqfA (hemolysin III family)
MRPRRTKTIFATFSWHARLQTTTLVLMLACVASLIIQKIFTGQMKPYMWGSLALLICLLIPAKTLFSDIAKSAWQMLTGGGVLYAENGKLYYLGSLPNRSVHLTKISRCNLSKSALRGKTFQSIVLEGRDAPSIWLPCSALAGNPVDVVAALNAFLDTGESQPGDAGGPHASHV